MVSIIENNNQEFTNNNRLARRRKFELISITQDGSILDFYQDGKVSGFVPWTAAKKIANRVCNSLFSKCDECQFEITLQELSSNDYFLFHVHRKLQPENIIFSFGGEYEEMIEFPSKYKTIVRELKGIDNNGNAIYKNENDYENFLEK